MLLFKYLQLIAILVCLVGAISPTNMTSNTNWQLPNPSQFNKKIITEPRCGDSFATETGAIYYKPFEAVVEHERCAWIIGVPLGLGYSINIQYLGVPTNIPESDQELVFTAIVQGNPPRMIRSYKPTETGIFIVEAANIIVVSFTSSYLGNSSESTGFALLYETIFTGSIPPTSARSTHHILASPTFDFRYPIEGSHFDKFELAAFVFPPKENVYMGGVKNLWFKLRAFGNGDNCVDGLDIFGFNISASAETGKWEGLGRICNQTRHNLLIPYEDMTLLLFHSNGESEGSGFYFWHYGC